MNEQKKKKKQFNNLGRDRSLLLLSSKLTHVWFDDVIEGEEEIRDSFCTILVDFPALRTRVEIGVVNRRGGGGRRGRGRGGGGGGGGWVLLLLLVRRGMKELLGGWGRRLLVLLGLKVENLLRLLVGVLLLGLGLVVVELGLLLLVIVGLGRSSTESC